MRVPPVRQRAEVVIIGAGFAGLEVARQLGAAGIDTTLIDSKNHHLFQPLLYQVATAALSATNVAVPIRRVLRRHQSVKVIFGEVCAIDTGRRELRLTCGERIAFGHLVLACGVRPGYFGNDAWAEWAPGLKTIEDAQRIRTELLLAFERAERTTDPVKRDRLLRVAVIGGGPTGVEMAGAIAELSRFTLARDFRSIKPGNMRITLIEAGPRLLAGFSEAAADYARQRLERLGVQIRTAEAVEDIRQGEIRIGGQTEAVSLIVWAAGNAASGLAGQLGKTDKMGRIPVDDRLAVPGQARIFALGDVALSKDAEGRALPGLAQVATQQGRYLGAALAGQITTGRTAAPFRFRNRGNTAIVGRHAAVFEHGRLRIKGWVAWLAWAVVHVYLLVGFQNRLMVASQWLWRYMTYERGARVISAEYVEVDDPVDGITDRANERPQG